MNRLNNEYGKINESTKNLEEIIKLRRKYSTEGSIIYAKSTIAANYGLLGDFDKAINEINEYVELLQFPSDLHIKLGIIQLIIKCEKWGLLKEYRYIVEEFVEYIPVKYTDLFKFDGLIAEHVEKDYTKAINLYNKFLDEDKGYRSSGIYISKASCYRKMKKYTKAIDILDDLSTSAKRNKFDSNYEYAQIYKDLNDYDNALKYINIYLEHYKNADKEYILINKGNNLKDEIIFLNNPS